MIRKFKSIALNEKKVLPIEMAVERINKLMSPAANTGELIIDYFEDGVWKCLYDGTLDGGEGKSCAKAKVDTLIAHPEYFWGGAIPENELAKGEFKWYGSIKLVNCWHKDSGLNTEIIIAFSDRKEWQDVFYVAGVIQVLEDSLKMEFKLPKGIENDPIWGTALNICKGIFYM